MATSPPYAQLVGPVKFYLAPSGTAEPAVNTTPASPWVEFGATEGDQTFSKQGANTYFSDNDHTGHVKAITPEETVAWRYTLVNMTQEHFSRVVSAVGNVTETTGPPNVVRVPNKSGYIPTEYALLAKGAADSPHGDLPGQNYIPRGVFEHSVEIVRGKPNRAAMACEFRALEDDNQSELNRMGWGTVQKS